MSKAPVAAVIGHPVNHSRSPRMHNYWLAQFGLEGYYIPLDIDPRSSRGAFVIYQSWDSWVLTLQFRTKKKY